MNPSIKKLEVYRINKCFTENFDALSPENGYLIQEVLYRSTGEIIQEVDCNENEEVVNKVVHQFDEKGHLVKEEVFFSEDEIAEYSVFENDEKGSPTRMEKFYSEGGSSTTEYKYDANSQLVERKVFDEEDVETLETRTYNSDRRICEVCIHNYGDLAEKETYDYNQDELVHTKSVAGEFGWEITKTYYKDKKVVRIEHLDENGKMRSFSDYFEDAEKKQTTIIERVGTVANKYVIEMDENGNIINQMDFSADGGLRSQLIHKYDGNQNPIFTSYRSLIQEVNIINSYSLINKYEYYS